MTNFELVGNSLKATGSGHLSTNDIKNAVGETKIETFTIGGTISDYSSPLLGDLPNFQNLETFIIESQELLTVKTLSVTSLKQVKLGSSAVLKINSYAFSNCRNLQSFEFSPCIQTIASCAFYLCTSLVFGDLPSSLISIESQAFGVCNSLEHVIFQSSTDESHAGLTLHNAFFQCQKISQISLPKQLKALESYLTYECLKLIKVDIPNDAPNFKVDAQGLLMDKNGSKIYQFPIAVEKNYYVPSTCRVIGQFAASRSNITGILLPLDLVTIEEYAFSNCALLRSIHFPNKLREILKSAFEGSTLETVTFQEGSLLSSIGSSTFALCKMPSFVFPKSLTVMNELAFSNCPNLKTVNFENGIQIKSFSRGCFTCSGLTKIVIPKSVEQIGFGVFKGCSNLTQVKFQDGSNLTNIGNFAFSGCNIGCIVLSKFVTLEDRSFQDLLSPITIYFQILNDMKASEVLYQTEVKKVYVPLDYNNTSFCSITGDKIEHISDFSHGCLLKFTNKLIRQRNVSPLLFLAAGGM